jgi:hypothetical protein
MSFFRERERERNGGAFFLGVWGGQSQRLLLKAGE